MSGKSSFLKKLGIMLGLFLTCILFGCYQVHTADIIGTWYLKDSSRSSLRPPANTATATVTLRTDGTFELRNVPDQLFYGDWNVIDETWKQRPQGLMVSGHGTWKLLGEKWERRIELKLIDFTDEQHRGTPYIGALYAAQFWPDHDLYFYLGDPDSGVRIDFERKTE